MTDEDAPQVNPANTPFEPEQEAYPSPVTLSPRIAILNAALVSLQYARQYLDKFLHWPDYILATYYYATVLALTTSEQNKDEAEQLFKDVEGWLQPTSNLRVYDDARRRIRLEAIYNRAIVLATAGRTSEARQSLTSLLTLVEEDSAMAPKGIRYATEFALISLDGQVILQQPSQEAVASQSERDVSSFGGTDDQRLQLLRRSEYFIQELQTEMLQVERNVASSDQVFAEEAKRHQNEGRDDPRIHRKTRRIKEEESVLTKASKDLVILRSMHAKVNELRERLEELTGLAG
jgi:hypothetical protein